LGSAASEQVVVPRATLATQVGGVVSEVALSPVMKPL
jgi:hypothetical protein